MGQRQVGWTRRLGRKRSRDPEAQPVIAVADGAAQAEGRAQNLRLVAPRAAANDTLDAIPPRPFCPVLGRAVVAVVIAVLDPLPGVAEHVVEAERVRRE